VLCAGFLVLLGYGAWRDLSLRAPAKDVPADWGGVARVGEELFNRWAFPFELVSVLIIVAILGAVILAKKKLPPES
jgi:NADH:ubiquinone oxidoreductase subunit 6 (subunit J)